MDIITFKFVISHISLLPFSLLSLHPGYLLLLSLSPFPYIFIKSPPLLFPSFTSPFYLGWNFQCCCFNKGKNDCVHENWIRKKCGSYKANCTSFFIKLNHIVFSQLWVVPHIWSIKSWWKIFFKIIIFL